MMILISFFDFPKRGRAHVKDETHSLKTGGGRAGQGRAKKKEKEKEFLKLSPSSRSSLPTRFFSF
jgi:hypothetical protein